MSRTNGLEFAASGPRTALKFGTAVSRQREPCELGQANAVAGYAIDPVSGTSCTAMLFALHIPEAYVHWPNIPPSDVSIGMYPSLAVLSLMRRAIVRRNIAR
jgi:hypothetical protein